MSRSVDRFGWYVGALLAAAMVGSPGPVYWDSFGYVAQSLTGDIGGLGVGRPLFALATQAIAAGWQWAGGSVWHLELVLRVACVMVSALAAPLTRTLALEAGLTPRAAGFAAGFVALSPAFAHTIAAVLTDGPAVPFVLLSWIAMLRATRDGRLQNAALSGAWLAIAIGLREGSLVAGLTCLCLLWRAPASLRLRLAGAFTLVCAVLTVLPMAWAAATQPGYVETVRVWLDGMAHDRALKTWNLRGAAVIAGWLVALGPVALPLTMMTWSRWRAAGEWRATLMAPAWVQWAIMATYAGVVYSPRYLLAAFPAAIALPAGWMLDRVWGPQTRRMAVLAALLPLLVTRVVIRSREAPVFEVTSSLARDLPTLPADAVIATGHACPAVGMIWQLATVEPRSGLVQPRWITVCPGWSWPADVTAVLDAHLASGRVVLLDLRPTAWRGDEQRDRLEDLREYWRNRAEAPPSRLLVWGEATR